MKRLLLFLAVVLPLTMDAQQGKYAKYINKFDVVQFLPEETDKDPAVFWRAVVNNNQTLKENMEKFTEPKGSAKKALEAVRRMNSENAIVDQRLPKRNFGNMSEELNEVMIGNCGTKLDFCVLDDSEWNAASAPDGHVYIYYGLIKRLDMKDEMLFGVLAHEVAHYMLNHILLHEYKSLKREKLNNIGAAIGMAGEAVGNMAAAAGGVSMGSSEEQAARYRRHWDNAEKSTWLFRYKYEREQEIEADIVAYRFLEWIGIDPAEFITALERTNLDNLTGAGEKDSDHPSTEFRVGLLKQLEPAKYRK